MRELDSILQKVLVVDFVDDRSVDLELDELGEPLNVVGLEYFSVFEIVTEDFQDCTECFVRIAIQALFDRERSLLPSTDLASSKRVSRLLLTQRSVMWHAAAS